MPAETTNEESNRSTPFRSVPECIPIYADGRMFCRTWAGIVCVDLHRP